MGLLVPASPAWAAHTELGIFEYDARTAHKLVEPEILKPDSREICSELGLYVVGQAYAEMFNLRQDETCSDSLFKFVIPAQKNYLRKITIHILSGIRKYICCTEGDLPGGACAIMPYCYAICR